MQNTTVCEWYTDKIKCINDRIWYPENIVENDDIKYPFNSEIINFKSFANNFPDKSQDLITNQKQKTYNEIKNQLTKRYYDMLIGLMTKTVADTYNYLQKTDNIKKFDDYEKLIQSTKEINSNKSLSREQKFKQTKSLIEKESGIVKGKISIPTDFISITNKYISKQNKSKDNMNKAIRLINVSIHSYKTKICVNDKQKTKLLQWFDTATKVYNKCVDLYNSKDPNFTSNYMTAKQYVFKKVFVNKKKETPYDILTYEVKCFFENLSSCYSNLSNNNINKFELKHKNTNKNQTITISKNGMRTTGIYPNLLGKIPDFSKHININKFDCDCKLTYDKLSGNFYVYIPQYIKNEKIESRKPICAIDPGEKVPFTYYSLNDYGFIGNDIRIKILARESKIRQLQRLLNKSITKNGNKMNKSKLKKKIGKEYQKIKGIVNELHKKSALYFCRNYDTILIPKFETQSMICDKQIAKNKIKQKYEEIKTENKDDKKVLCEKLKEYKRHRRLNGRVKFVLQQLSHYKFKQHLFAKAKEYGCLCVEVTEEFTSQLCTVCGDCSKSFIGRTKRCITCKSEINRDVNGSRNILLKNISGFLKS